MKNVILIEEHKKFYKNYNWAPYNEAIEKLKIIKDWNEFWEILEKMWAWYGDREVIKYTRNPPHPTTNKTFMGQRIKFREELIDYHI